MINKTSDFLSLIIGYSSMYFLSNLFVKQADRIKNSDGLNQN